MRNTKKLLSVLLCIALLATTVCGIVPFTASAADDADLSDTGAEAADLADTGANVIEVSDMSTFKTLMESDDNVSMILTQNLRADVQRKGNEIDGFKAVPYFITAGHGKKVVDLNGWGIMATLREYKGTATRSTMFSIPEGSEVVINDSSGTDKGEIFYDGYIDEFEQYRNSTMNLDTKNQNRDIFHVNGGKLTINGGSIIAGRMKEERYMGHYMNKIMNGTAVELNAGTLVINGGNLTARGMHEVPAWPKCALDDISDAIENGEIKDEVDCYMTRNAVVEAHSGDLIVNYGVFYARSSADVFQIDDPFYDKNEAPTNAQIKSAKYFRHKNDKDTNFLRCLSVDVVDGMYRPSSYGYIGTPYSCYDLDRITFTTQGNWTNVLPERSHQLFSYVKGGNEGFQSKGDVNYVGDGSKSVCVPIDSLWGGEAVCRNYGHEPGHFIRLNAYVYRGDTGTNPKITIGGGTVVSEFSHKPEDKPLIKKMYVAYPDTDEEINIPLSELTPDDYHPGDDLTVYLVQADEYFTYNGSLRDYYCASKVMHIVYPYEPVKVTGQPQNIVADRGEQVTFTATVSGEPTDMWWESNTQYGAERFEPTSFDGTTATLTLDGSKGMPVRACFKGKYGTVSSNVAYLSIKPKKVTQDQHLTMYTTSHRYTFTSRADITGIGNGNMRWQKAKKISVVNGETVYTWDNTFLTYNSHIQTYTDRIVFNDPQPDDAGAYRLTITYGDNSLWTSEVLDITVAEGYPPNRITSVEINGMGNLYVGETPPALSDLSCNDPRVIIKEITWSGLSKGATGTLTPNSMFTIKLAASNANNITNYYQYDQNGELPWKAIGVNRTVSSRCYASPGMLDGFLTLSYAFDNHTYLKEALDEVYLKESCFDLYNGQDVDIQLEPTLVCPEKHETKHNITYLGVYNSMPLPAGLSMDTTGHITGKLTESPANKTFATKIQVNGNLYNSLDTVILFNIYTNPSDLGKNIDLNAVDGVYHNHTYNAWSADDEYRHGHACTICGCEEHESHNWSDDYEVIEEATPEQDGLLRYTCEDCGAKKTVPYEYEPEGPDPSGKLGDADNDGDVTILDATVIQRFLADLPNETPFITPQADVDCDTEVTIIDATGIQRYLAGLTHPAGIGAMG